MLSYYHVVVEWPRAYRTKLADITSYQLCFMILVESCAFFLPLSLSFPSSLSPSRSLSLFFSPSLSLLSLSISLSLSLSPIPFTVHSPDIFSMTKQMVIYHKVNWFVFFAPHNDEIEKKCVEKIKTDEHCFLFVRWSNEQCYEIFHVHLLWRTAHTIADCFCSASKCYWWQLINLFNRMICVRVRVQVTGIQDELSGIRRSIKITCNFTIHFNCWIFNLELLCTYQKLLYCENCNRKLVDKLLIYSETRVSREYFPMFVVFHLYEARCRTYRFLSVYRRCRTFNSFATKKHTHTMYFRY